MLVLTQIKSYIKNKWLNFKYFFEGFDYLKVYFSPFIRPKLKLYCGKIAIGTPYFYPRKWIEDKKIGKIVSVPKKIGFDFVSLGWKTKWSETDIRFEHASLISFVFFKWQVVLFFTVPETSRYWEAWIYYNKYTNKKESVEKRITQAIKEYPMIWTVYKEDSKQKVNYWNYVLKKEYVKLVPELKQ